MQRRLEYPEEQGNSYLKERTKHKSHSKEKSPEQSSILEDASIFSLHTPPHQHPKFRKPHKGKRILKTQQDKEKADTSNPRTLRINREAKFFNINNHNVNHIQ